LEAIVSRCKNWEGMKPSEVFGSGGNKQIPTEKLSAAAQARLAQLELDDYEIWELRLSGTQRIWGVRQSNIFYPIWWDPHHQICPSRKRNT
jgi:hypothetical protein